MRNFQKYKNKKVEIDGIQFDSLKEGKRYLQLKDLEKNGEIQNLKLQVPFELIPAQYEESKEFYKKGKNKGLPKPGKLIELPCTYKADFVYEQDGKTIVEDVKGVRTEAYKIKRKLLLFRTGIKLKEV